MLGSVAGLPDGVLGLKANGTVIAPDVAQALDVLQAEAQGARGLVVFLDPDFDGYLAELVAGLGSASSVDQPLFRKWALVLPVLMAIIAVLMVSTVRYPSGKQVDMQTTTRLTRFVTLLICVAAVIVFKEVGLLVVALGYIGFGLVRHLRRSSSHPIVEYAPSYPGERALSRTKFR